MCFFQKTTLKFSHRYVSPLMEKFIRRRIGHLFIFISPLFHVLRKIELCLFVCLIVQTYHLFIFVSPLFQVLRKIDLPAAEILGANHHINKNDKREKKLKFLILSRTKGVKQEANIQVFKTRSLTLRLDTVLGHFFGKFLGTLFDETFWGHFSAFCKT